MNIKEIKEMIQLMNENNLSEMELEKEGLKIRLKKTTGGVIEQSTAPVPAPAAAAPREESPQAAAGEKSKKTINAPMVGTFYTAPSPDSPPFVAPGSEISVGQVVCIIEAMKLMNEIKSEVRGKIVQVLVNNAEPIEFGQPLFVLE